MFLQVKVALGDRDLLRFFWYPDGNYELPPEEYRLTVHIFGATSSPAVAALALKKLADEHEEEFDPDVIEFLRKNFYVDDGLKSDDEVDVVVERILQSRELCSKGQFNLRKYACSNEEVMRRLPEEIKAEGLTEIEISNGNVGQSTLGLLWSLLEDAWKFKIKQQSQEMTRRGMLSTLSSIYDPLGLISPVMLRGRNILQRLCREGYTWDNVVPDDALREWNEWYNELGNLDALSIGRCYRRNVQVIEQVEYHVCADASGDGYGACAYVVTRGQGQVDSTLALAKSKVSPSKSVTIPRLELQAAVMAVKLLDTLLRELPYENVKVYLWSDSQIVLAYIANESLRFLIYVANRVQYIRDRTDPANWHYIDTRHNPTDLASRGCTASELLSSELWWYGPPEFLNPPNVTEKQEVPLDDPELRREKQVLSTEVDASASSWPWYTTDLLRKLSSLPKVVRTVSIWRRFLKNALHKIRGEPLEDFRSNLPNVQERREALQFLIRVEQQEELSDVYQKLIGESLPADKAARKARQKKLESSSSLGKLDPYLDGDGLLRVGGRLKRSEFDNHLKHPIVLPSQSWLTTLIVQRYHELSGHQRVNHTLGATREAGYWLMRGRKTVNRVIRPCVTCRRLKSPLMSQKMADLPYDRVKEAPPFTYCGVDLLGPVMVKNDRVERKRWICLFTCLVSRCIHLEVCDHLTTDSFLSAYRRFVSRRGPIRVLRSDQGTNIVGTRNELQKLWEELDHGQIARKLADDGCDMEIFHLNVPRAPHMGGAWERLVGSVKRTLRALLLVAPARLTDWSLLTLAAEVEAIVNSRPLTYVQDSDATEPTALSPIRLLTLKGDHIPSPPGRFTREDLYSKRQWRRTQYLANQFWTRWRREYLPTIQMRKKWLQEEDNVPIDDVVLVQEESADRSVWPLGRVVDRKVGSDGLVRSVTVKTRAGTYQRPICRLVLVFGPTQDVSVDEATSA